MGRDIDKASKIERTCGTVKAKARDRKSERHTQHRETLT